MPAATPIPRGPSVLTLYTASDLLTGPGCPVCRYAGEAADRYLAWFALEAHADPVIITGLCSSLGMCPRHTRALMRQPGAATRLTAVYRYVLPAAGEQLSGRPARLRGCPGCEHDDSAADRALDTLLEGLADSTVRDRYRELGGLCIPHLRAASASASRGRHRELPGWLSRAMMADVTGDLGRASWLAGTDFDSELRHVLRQSALATARPGCYVCAACLAVSRSENDLLAEVLRAGDRGQPDGRLLVCAGHLGDLVVIAGQRGTTALLAWQAGCLAAGLTGPRSAAAGPPGWLRFRRSGPYGCPVCRAGEEAARRAVDGVRVSLRVSRPGPGGQATLCVRHLLDLRAVDRQAGHVAARGAVEQAGLLIAELSEAFFKNTWAHRHDPRGPEMTAWRRTAAFLDGRVFCGGPPVNLPACRNEGPA
jgi:hypothetical protein